MKLHKNITRIAKTICLSSGGNLTENIIQNIFLNKLMRAGLHCQQQVVMPVLVDGMFVGHNRFDIMVTENEKTHTSITIIEIKTLSQSIHTSKNRERIFEQCAGYQRCVEKMIRKKTKIEVILVNIWKKRTNCDHDTPYKSEIVNVSLRRALERKRSKTLDIKPNPILKGRTKYFEIESILDSCKRGVKKHTVLVKWSGFTVPSWEPLANIPVLIRNLYAHIIHPTHTTTPQDMLS